MSLGAEPPSSRTPRGITTAQLYYDSAISTSPPPHNPFPSSSSMKSSFSPSVLIILIILAITIFASVSFCLLLRYLNRHCLVHLSNAASSEFTSAASSNRRVSPVQKKHPTPLKDSLPIFTFASVTRQRASDAAADCAICLSKFQPHHQLRLLPLCCHAFHAYCVDIWLQSNDTCPLCRSPVSNSESDILKALKSSYTDSTSFSGDSFRLEIGSVSQRRAVTDSSTEARRSYSIGSFEYLVEEETEVILTNANSRNFSNKEEIQTDPPDRSTAADSTAGSGRGWLMDYVDRVSNSLSSRALSFRSSGIFFTGSSRRMEMEITGVDYDVEGNRVGEEISEMFRWFSGV